MPTRRTNRIKIDSDNLNQTGLERNATGAYADTTRATDRLIGAMQNAAGTGINYANKKVDEAAQDAAIAASLGEEKAEGGWNDYDRVQSAYTETKTTLDLDDRINELNDLRERREGIFQDADDLSPEDVSALYQEELESGIDTADEAQRRVLARHMPTVLSQQRKLQSASLLKRDVERKKTNVRRLLSKTTDFNVSNVKAIMQNGRDQGLSENDVQDAVVNHIGQMAATGEPELLDVLTELGLDVDDSVADNLRGYRQLGEKNKGILERQAVAEEAKRVKEYQSQNKDIADELVFNNGGRPSVTINQVDEMVSKNAISLSQGTQLKKAIIKGNKEASEAAEAYDINAYHYERGLPIPLDKKNRDSHNKSMNKLEDAGVATEEEILKMSIDSQVFTNRQMSKFSNTLDSDNPESIIETVQTLNAAFQEAPRLRKGFSDNHLAMINRVANGGSYEQAVVLRDIDDSFANDEERSRYGKLAKSTLTVKDMPSDIEDLFEGKFGTNDVDTIPGFSTIVNRDLPLYLKKTNGNRKEAVKLMLDNSEYSKGESINKGLVTPYNPEAIHGSDEETVSYINLQTKESLKAAGVRVPDDMSDLTFLPNPSASFDPETITYKVIDEGTNSVLLDSIKLQPDVVARREKDRIAAENRKQYEKNREERRIEEEANAHIHNVTGAYFFKMLKEESAELIESRYSGFKW